MYPLDESMTQSIIQENRKTQAPVPLEELSEQLELPIEDLKESQCIQASDTEEYWLNWFQETLENCDVAKRANRDFNKSDQRENQSVNLVTAHLPKARERENAQTR